MDQFDQWLIERGVDCIGMTRELRAAMFEQFKAEQQAKEPPAEVIVVPESVDGRWATALRVSVCEVGA